MNFFYIFYCDQTFIYRKLAMQYTFCLGNYTSILRPELLTFDRNFAKILHVNHVFMNSYYESK